MKTTQRSSALDKVLGHLDNLDAVNLTILVQRLARERKLLETVFNTIQEGIVVIDSDGMIAYANAAACRLIGLDPQEVGHAELSKWVPGLTALDPEATGGFARELNLTYPESRLVRLYGVPFCTPEDPKPQQLLIFHDITEDRASEQTNLEEEKLASILQLAEGVAHDLGNPLNTLSIHLQLLKRSLSEHANTTQTLGICLQEVKRLNHIVTHFLEAVRPKSLQWKSIDLIALVEDVLRFHEPQLKDLDIQTSIELKDPLPLIQGDPHQLKQVLYNGVKNAIDAMRQGGALRVVASLHEQELHLQLIDTGQGIREADLPQVFDRHFTTKSSGHGLGMLIIHRIVRAHGGRVSLDSRPQTGTVLTLHFPIAAPQRQISEGPTPHP